MAQVVAGLEHSCALLASGEARCWGSNRFGELGDGTEAWMSAVPVPVASVTDAVQLAAFGRLTCATLGSGSVTCWGTTERAARLRPPTVGPRDRPSVLAGIDDAVSVSVGGNHLCILDRAARVRCGDLTTPTDGSTQLGVSMAPVFDAAPGITQLVSGEDHDCALTERGQVLCRGHHGLAPPGPPLAPPGSTAAPELSDVVQIAAGARHTCARIADGTVSCWGYNAQGQGGQAGLGGYLGTPSLVPGLSGATDLQAGGAHTCAISTDGKVSCWGADNALQLGVPPSRLHGAVSGVPVAVPGILGARGLAAGNAHNCAIVSDGAVICWGDDRFGQSGGDPIGGLRRIEGADDVATIAAGDRLCLRTATGTVACVGPGSGHPVPVPGLSGVVDVAVGQRHGCAVDRRGQVWCWGRHVTDSDHGEPPFVYGDGLRASRIPGIGPGSSVAVGPRHACALLRAGTVSCWGTGWLGDGRQARSESPIAVPGLDRVRDIAAGQDWTLAVRDDGTVYCWGACGVLGGDWQSVPRPRRIPGIDDARKVVAAGAICILRAAGRITCLGSLGDPGIPPPAAVDLSIGQYGGAFACLLAAEGGVACWGDNRAGQLGDGARTPRTSPVPVPGITDAVQVAAGAGYACALLRDGGLRCWGERAPGRIGGRDPTGATLPSRIPHLGPSRSGRAVVQGEDCGH